VGCLEGNRKQRERVDETVDRLSFPPPMSLLFVASYSWPQLLLRMRPFICLRPQHRRRTHVDTKVHHLFSSHCELYDKDWCQRTACANEQHLRTTWADTSRPVLSQVLKSSYVITFRLQATTAGSTAWRMGVHWIFKFSSTNGILYCEARRTFYALFVK
jgi:hypothetical protein